MRNLIEPPRASLTIRENLATRAHPAAACPSLAVDFLLGVRRKCGTRAHSSRSHQDMDWPTLFANEDPSALQMR
jgi:hypothetical protein